MPHCSRRSFLKTAALGASLLLAPRSAKAAEARIEVLMQEPIGRISPDLYGHFTEHIGGVIYDGIWVGEDSTVPNIHGIRAALVEQMKKIKPPVVRWPGGCFADSYNWRDGIGPRSQRPKRTNFWIVDDLLRRAPDGPQKYDPNQFGTNEFIQFCRLVGAEPYLAANVRSLTPRDFDEWVEYCNAPEGTTTLAEQRASTGDREPFNVRYWGVGNESWGCGGNFTPEEYAAEFRRFTAWVPNYGPRLSFIGSGPNGGDYEWTRRFFHQLTERDRGQLGNLYGWALHYYCGTAGKGQAIDFTVADWYELLSKAEVMEALITLHWMVMGETDREHRVKLIVDEWGAWHRAGTEVDPRFLFGQTPTLRDALVSALTLDIFNRHADKVAMANVAQLINNLHALFLAHEDHFIVTPNFHVFEMYAAHQGGQSLRTLFSVPRISAASGQRAPLRGLSGSASLHDQQLILTVVNPHVSEARETEIVLRGATMRSCQTRTLTATDIHAHNSFEHAAAIMPKNGTATAQGAAMVYNFPPASVTRLSVELG